MKIFESEVSTGNASGKAGVPSIPFGRGFYQSGNNGAFGTTFTPSGEPTSTTYKSMKHSKKNLKKKMKKFNKFNEDATATAGNTGGMGNVVAAVPSSTPGDVAGSIPGSGDIGQSLGGAFMKSAPNLRKRKDGKYKMKKLKSYDGFNPLKESEDIDNFTARYYDNFDDEEETANENDLINFDGRNKKIQMFEDFSDKMTYEMSGSPKPYFKTKAEFVEEMLKYGFHHTTLNKNTNMLIVADEDLGTLKCQKAEKYGIPIYTYRYAKKEMKNLKDNVTKYNL